MGGTPVAHLRCTHCQQQGEPPLPFWQAIVAPKKVYGGPEVKGWLAELFPYIGGKRNPLFAMPLPYEQREEGVHPFLFPLGLLDDSHLGY